MIYWTKAEEKELLTYLAKKLPSHEIAAKFGYHINTIEEKIKDLRKNKKRVVRPDYVNDCVRIEWE